jgi:2'-5' RNA ligase
MGTRLFVSVDLDDLAEEVARVQAPLRLDGLRPTDPADAHVTVKFLGDTDPDRIGPLTEALEAAAAAADVGAFDVSLGGYGVFPSLEYISVVYLGVRAGANELTRLHEAVEARTTDLGFDPEDHEFTPHVTLARMDHAASKDRVGELVRERDPDAGRTRVSELRLTESTLTDDGPVYETVAAVPL